MDVPLSINIESGCDSIRVRVSGELDMWSSPSLQAVFDNIERKGHSRLTLDLSEVTFVDSEAIKTLVTGSRDLKKKGITLSVNACSRYVTKVFEMVGVDRLIAIDNVDVV